MTKQAVIKLQDIWISYPDNFSSPHKSILDVFSKKQRKGHWALKGINFEVNQGEVLGVIGRNGSGKSTLLKLLSGLISPDKGRFTVRGSKPVLLSLGAGFEPELSGLDNIYLNGLLLGFDKKKLDERIAKIVEFAELQDFIDKPIRTYSTGMRARLAFSTAIELDPEVLLIDEVLGVGDAAFQKKCNEAIVNKIKQNRTVILVTHSAALVKELCDRAVWIHLGEQRMVGNATEVVTSYLDFMKGIVK